MKRLNASLHHDASSFLDRLAGERDDVADAELALSTRLLDGGGLRNVMEAVPGLEQQVALVSKLVRQGIRGQKSGLNITTYESPDNASSATASPIHPGLAPSSLSRTSLRPGARNTISASTASAITTCNVLRPSRRGSSSRGILTGPGPVSGLARYG